MIEAIGFFGNMDDGISKPKKFLCSDNIMRVVKFNHPENYTRALLHEFLGYKIAALLELPVLDQKLVNIPRELAEIYSHVEGMTPGIKVGSPLVELDKNIADNGLFREPLPELYRSCSNVGMIQDVLAYDIWIHNDDRGSNMGNLLVLPKKDGSKEFVVHDHGYAFFRPVATMDRYKSLQEFKGASLTWQDHLFPFGPIYEAIKINVDLRNPQLNPFLRVVNKIESVSKQELEQIMNEVPEEWQIPDYEKKVLVSFLFDRRFKVREAIIQLVSMWWFPVWNGGALVWPDLQASSE
ncbi:HipA family kinase [Paenibacillus piscarius]|uniref:HipA family kinase n=1 Tax=Paenibacillus piscarius TaxID=1089681 RepID=UPI001EE79E49|nr:HipA family kinase [Paenibacillus piscarius]